MIEYRQFMMKSQADPQKEGHLRVYEEGEDEEIVIDCKTVKGWERVNENETPRFAAIVLGFLFENWDIIPVTFGEL
jgi:hypothetical protein